MKEHYPKNFDPAYYWYFDGAGLEFDAEIDADIPTTNIWKCWYEGNEDYFPATLSQIVWNIFADSIDFFTGSAYPKLYDSQIDVNVKSIRNYLNQYVELIGNDISDNWPEMNAFEMEVITFNDEDAVLKLSAYAIMQIDLGITGLFKNDAISASRSFLNAKQANETSFGCMRQRYKAEESTSDGNENFKKYKTIIAKQNATKRHEETYELKKQAIDYWRSYIDPELSNDAAAKILLKVVALSPRKLSQYVAEAKKLKILTTSKV